MNPLACKVAILLNGPPRAGKDTAVEALAPALGQIAEVFKFTRPVKDLTHREAGIDCAHDAYEELKDVPLPEFGGRTPRQAYIDTSRALKDREGEDAVARLFVKAIQESGASVILNPDCGDDMEALCVAEAFSPENVFVIRIHREGHDFSKDCRTWVTSDRLNVVDVVNRSGMRREFESEVVARVKTFLENLPAAAREYAA